ncbi:MAG: carbon storage regulator CsrA [Bythopirellula sp.]
MLVLSRKTNETINIGDDITVTVLSVRGGKVRLGLDAPQEVPIMRSELQEPVYSEEHELWAEDPKESHRQLF